MNAVAALKTIAGHLTDARLALVLLAASLVAVLVQVVAGIYMKIRGADCNDDGCVLPDGTDDPIGAALHTASHWSQALTLYLALTGGWLAYLAIELKGKK